MPLEALLAELKSSSALVTHALAKARPCPVPREPGVYGWWFKKLPASSIDASNCAQRDCYTLLYVGISPSTPPTSGRSTSTQTLRERVNAHFVGNANGSTLRKTLGCLLAAELDLELRRVGAGNRMTFLDGEKRLSAWIAENTATSWALYPAPWDVEGNLINALDLPLNLLGNSNGRFHAELSRARTAAIARARELPVATKDA